MDTSTPTAVPRWQTKATTEEDWAPPGEDPHPDSEASHDCTGGDTNPRDGMEGVILPDMDQPFAGIPLDVPPDARPACGCGHHVIDHATAGDGPGGCQVCPCDGFDDQPTDPEADEDQTDWEDVAQDDRDAGIEATDG